MATGQMTLIGAINAVAQLNTQMKSERLEVSQQGNMICLHLNGGLLHGTTNPDCFVSYVAGLLVGRTMGIKEAEAAKVGR